MSILNEQAEMNEALGCRKAIVPWRRGWNTKALLFKMLGVTLPMTSLGVFP